ncbi:MAG: ACT domain-containing protein [candidate division Zixibacteria bacterium]|nr:ACT domain-containing protein [candidate division Zixibacteria bacterium]
MHPLVEKVREAGVVGAGFPAYVKYDATVNTLIANGAECEPLLYKDKELMRLFPAGGPPRQGGAVGSSLQPPDEAMITAEGGLYEQIEKTDKTRVIIAAFGKDRPGVGAALTGVLAEHNCSIENISQTLLQDFFSMIMIVNIEGSTVDFATLVERLKATETTLGIKVYVMHEDIFRYMHRI